MPERAQAALKAGLNMKQHSWKLFTRLGLIFFLGFVSLLHANDPILHNANKSSQRYRAEGRLSPLQFVVFSDFLKNRKDGFETVITKKDLNGGTIISENIVVSRDEVANITGFFDSIKKYRTGLDGCVGKASDLTDKDGTSNKLAVFVDEFQSWLTDTVANTNQDGTFHSPKDEDVKKEGVQIQLSDKKLLAHIVAVQKYLEAKKDRFQQTVLSAGDKTLIESMSKLAHALTGSESTIKEDKIGPYDINFLENDEEIKPIFESVKKAIDALSAAKEICIVNIDTGVPPAPPSRPLEAPRQSSIENNSTSPTTEPAVIPNAPNPDSGVPPVAPNSGLIVNTGHQVEPIDHKQAETIRALQDAIDRLMAQMEQDKKEKEEEVDPIDRLEEMFKNQQPEKDKGKKGGSTPPGGSAPSPSISATPSKGEPQQQFPEPNQQSPQDSGLSQLLPMMLNQGRGGANDLSPELLKAMARPTNEVPYTPPAVALSNPKQDALMDTMRGWFMNQMMQSQAMGRPNIYNTRAGAIQGFGGAPAMVRTGSIGNYAFTGAKAGQLAVPGARTNKPSALQLAVK